MNRAYIAPYYMKNRHLQTLFASFFRADLELHVEKNIFNFDDGDFTEYYWYNRPDFNSKTPIVILFHGLTGSYKSSYIQGAMRELASAGYGVVLMQFRSCGSELNNLPRSYHSGETQDARVFIDYISKTYANSKLFGVGYSLGGNMLLKLLGEDGSNSKLSGAVSVSAPLKLSSCANAINSGSSKFYQHILLKDLKRTLLRKFKKHDMKTLLHVSEKDVKKIKTFWEFDEIYTAKIHNFNSASHYYDTCSAFNFLKYIEVPTLIIHSTDDPFMSIDIVPTKNDCSKNIELEIYRDGGHVGFITGSFKKPIYWLDKRVKNYFDTLGSINST